ncbi:hypothetical protein PENTCL1PPCAC_10528, partial [Pristionchus entomophagus]
TLSPMTVSRIGPASCVLNGKLYVFGGLSSDESFTAIFLDEDECYDPETDRWTPIPSRMKHRRYSASGAVLNGKIYVVGG